MASRKLTAADRTKILHLLAQRESHGAIAQALQCSVDNIDYYAKRYAADIEQIRTEYDSATAKLGVRQKEYRLRKLQRLADRLEAELETNLYYDEIKINVATGGTVIQKMFNAPLVVQYRAVLADGAAEEGGRIKKADITSDGKPITLVAGIDLEKI